MFAFEEFSHIDVISKFSSGLPFLICSESVQLQCLTDQCHCKTLIKEKGNFVHLCYDTAFLNKLLTDFPTFQTSGYLTAVTWQLTNHISDSHFFVTTHVKYFNDNNNTSEIALFISFLRFQIYNHLGFVKWTQWDCKRFLTLVTLCDTYPSLCFGNMFFAFLLTLISHCILVICTVAHPVTPVHHCILVTFTPCDTCPSMYLGNIYPVTPGILVE